ncbi:hypothetical protein FQN57_000196 [Myotisia sp. PD_48]|nr:hypothetical protein FQN57_000196 [Myotisia sp. PD_48]
MSDQPEQNPTGRKTNDTTIANPASGGSQTIEEYGIPGSTLELHHDGDDEEFYYLTNSRSQHPQTSSQEWDNIHRVVSALFGRSRYEASKEAKPRHLGIVWKRLTVKGVGMGATLQKTITDLILAVPRLLWNLVTGKIKSKPPVRTILDDLTGYVGPSEMLLVLGQPGAGCSTFLKVLGNQRAGYEEISGDVSYGGTDAQTMAKNYRSEVLYNPEEDLHHATLTVKETLSFAIKTRTPGKESRLENESRGQYQRTFLTNVAKLFWIEHCLDTKVGNNIVRGVSGGEKKRVSIAEGLITKASTQCWDNSTRGLDASSALEYVQSLRSVTDMTHVSTLVAIYQASESLYKHFDKVILLIEGKCAYFGPANKAKAYFEELGFEAAPRATTADFLTSVAEPHARRVKIGWKNRIPRTGVEFKEAYDRSKIHRETLISIKKFENELRAQNDDHEADMTPSKKNFTISFPKQVALLSYKQLLVMIGDRYSTFGKWTTRITGVAVQALVVYTGYLIPPREMRPWLKWLIWINPVQYCFESLMSNEFYRLHIECVPPNIVPNDPSQSFQFQSCLVQGSQPGQRIVEGSDYIFTNYTYTRAHLWRNFGIIIAFLVLFIALTMIGAELQNSSHGSTHGGAAVTVFMRDQVPKSLKQELKGSKKRSSRDLEVGEKDTTALNSPESSSSGEDEIKAFAKSSSIFTWQNVAYIIPYKGGEKKLLQNVSGYVKPGRLTALMGASGAGKTTLLNALAQRIDYGVVTGDFLIDGRSLPKSFQRATGFAEQADIHEPTSTVRESLRFSALLRQPQNVSKKEKYNYCERIIDLLELRPIAGAVVGNVGTGLNQEQRKRVTIAVELASKPELLLFLDEPTSGLDSLAAFNIVRFLRKLTDLGQAVLCTIHQPSAILFEEFDDLLLLQSGGRVVYHGDLGPDCKTLISYFANNGAKPCPRRANPAEYMLDVIGAGNPDYDGPDWAEIWVNSPEHQDRIDEIDHIVSTASSRPLGDNQPSDREFAMPLWSQVVATTKRSFLSYWRSPDYVVGKFMLHIWTGLFNTFTFWHLGETTIDMQSRLFSIFLTLVIAPPLIQQLQPRFIHIRGLYEAREAKSKIYSWFACVTSAILPELPYSIVAGSILASIAPTALFASLLVPAFFTFVISFCGVVVPYVNIPHFWRTWMYWLTPFHYLVEGLLGVATNTVPMRCSEKEYARFPAPPGMTCEEYAGPFARTRGGYVIDDNGQCAFCQYANGNQFAAGFNIFYRYKWRNYVGSNP